MKTFDSSYFISRRHFKEDGKQSYLVFQPVQKYVNKVSSVGSGNYIYSAKSKGLSDEHITAPTTKYCKINPELSYFGSKTKVEFDGSCLKQNKVIFNNGKVVNIYIVYEINDGFPISSYPTLENCLFGAVSLTKNVDIDRYKYFGYGIGFNRHFFISWYWIRQKYNNFWSRYEFFCTC